MSNFLNDDKSSEKAHPAVSAKSIPSKDCNYSSFFLAEEEVICYPFPQAVQLKTRNDLHKTFKFSPLKSFPWGGRRELPICFKDFAGLEANFPFSGCHCGEEKRNFSPNLTDGCSSSLMKVHFAIEIVSSELSHALLQIQSQLSVSLKNTLFRSFYYLKLCHSLSLLRNHQLFTSLVKLNHESTQPYKSLKTRARDIAGIESRTLKFTAPSRKRKKKHERPSPKCSGPKTKFPACLWSPQKVSFREKVKEEKKVFLAFFQLD